MCFDDSPAEFERCFPAFDAPEVDGEVLESFEFVAEVLEVLKENFFVSDFEAMEKCFLTLILNC